jgi:hypothetical protein
MAQRLKITFADNKTAIVQPTLEDRLNFESTLRKNRQWGDLKDNTLKLQPFLGWSAAVREGVTKLTWDEFTRGKKAAIDVEPVTDPDPAPEVEGVGEGSAKEPSNS